jgi:putative ABC transport system permease protein
VLAVNAAALRPQPLAWLAFFLIGIVVAGLGAWLPAREAARRPPAQALKAGDAEVGLAAQRTSTAGIVLLIAGGALAWLPDVHSLPLFGYASVAALLFGAVLLVPVVSSALLARAPRIGNVPFDVALAQLQGSVGQSTLSLAAIIVSFSLMVAMAIMVFSFRVSFERWLGTILPADVQLRVALGSDTAFWSADLQAAIAHAPGVARAQFRRIEPLYLAAERAPVLLIARDIDLARVSTALPLVTSTTPTAPADTPPAWISEAVLDLYGYRPGQRITLPLLGRHVPFYVAGIYRDYGRSTGAIVIPRNVYVALTGDRSATDGALWLAPGAKPRAVEAAVRACFARADALEIRTSTEVRELSLQIFDRAFAITYGLEGIAVLIGLVGVSFGAASTALARRVEFGMLRHVGMLRRQVIAMLAYEGLVLSALGVIYGLLLGGVLSIVLVYVINRQSFSWSVDLAVPWSELGALGVILMVAAAATAILSGRTAMSSDAVRAVREDW